MNLGVAVALLIGLFLITLPALYGGGVPREGVRRGDLVLDGAAHRGEDPQASRTFLATAMPRATRINRISTFFMGFPSAANSLRNLPAAAPGRNRAPPPRAGGLSPRLRSGAGRGRGRSRRPRTRSSPRVDQFLAAESGKDRVFGDARRERYRLLGELSDRAKDRPGLVEDGVLVLKCPRR